MARVPEADRIRGQAQAALTHLRIPATLAPECSELVTNIRRITLEGQQLPPDVVAAHETRYKELARAYNPKNTTGQIQNELTLHVIFDAAIASGISQKERTLTQERAVRYVADGRVELGELDREHKEAVQDVRDSEVIRQAEQNIDNLNIKLRSSIASLEAGPLLAQAGFELGAPVAEPPGFLPIDTQGRNQLLTARVESLLENVTDVNLHGYLAQQITAFEQSQIAAILDPRTAKVHTGRQLNALANITVALLGHSEADKEALHQTYLATVREVLGLKKDAKVPGRYVLLGRRRLGRRGQQKVVQTRVYQRIQQEQKHLHPVAPRTAETYSSVGTQSPALDDPDDAELREAGLL